MDHPAVPSLSRSRRQPIHNHGGDLVPVFVRLRGFHKAERERVFLPLLAASVLTDRQPGIGDAAAQLLIPQARQHHVSGRFLAGSAAGAGFEGLAKVIDAQDEALSSCATAFNMFMIAWPTALSYSSPA